MKAKAVTLKNPGGVENFSIAEIDLPEISRDEVLIRQNAVGLNFVDIYHRTGLYPLPAYPAILGVEAAGVVEKTGKGVKDFKAGDRVCYCTTPPGAYCNRRIVNQRYLVKLPDSIDMEQAAGSMVKGLTAYYLLHKTCKVKKGDFVLLHAAAGGVGQLLAGWAKKLGARVIGTVGSDEKIKAAIAAGCAHAINYRAENFAAKVLEITGGRGVRVVYDSVGKSTIVGSLESLASLGMLVSFGQSSGPVPAFDLSLLGKKSLFLTRPSLFTYMAEPEQLQEGAAAFFAEVGKGNIELNIAARYPLKDVAIAHQDLEARRIIGSAVLIP